MLFRLLFIFLISLSAFTKESDVEVIERLYEGAISSNQSIALEDKMLELSRFFDSQIQEAQIQNNLDLLDRAYLELGDLYHWLGHLSQEQGKLKTALEYHLKSQSYYSRTSVETSERINGANGRVHSHDHVDWLRKLLDPSHQLSVLKDLCG